MNRNIRLSLALACLCATTTKLMAKNEMAALSTFEIGAKINQELSLNVRAATYWKNHLEQFADLEQQNVYDSLGMSGMEYGVGGKLKIGKIGNLDIIARAEMAIYFRDIADSYLADSAIITPGNLRVYLPSSGVDIKIPVTGIFFLGLNNSFERRIATKPKSITYWIWAPQIIGSTVPFFGINLSPFVYYQGFDNENQRYLATYGYGFNCEPVSGLLISLSNRVQWNPEPLRELTSQRINQINFKLGYTFDFSK